MRQLQSPPLNAIPQAKLELEIASLRAQADDRRTRRERVHGGVAAADVTMEGIAV